MAREIRLSGSEISILKALTPFGTPVAGRMLMSRMGEGSGQELVDTLQGLMDMDYVVSSKVNIVNIEDVERAFFRVNSTCADELRDALRPGNRSRDEQRGRRERRR